MSGKFLLDTNIVIGLFAGESIVKRHLEKAEEIFVPSIVLGELYFGAYKSGQVRDNLARIDELADNIALLVCDAGTAKEYGIIKHGLRALGRPIPENDVWIAAIAGQYNLTLVTRDTHFDEIESLKVTTW